MAPQIRKPAPTFQGTAVIKGEFEEISSKNYEGKWLVVFFWPMDFTFVCPTEVAAMNEMLPEFKKVGCEVVGVSVDSEFVHAKWANEPRSNGGVGPDLDLTLLSDKSHKISEDYGVLIKDDEDKSVEGTALRGTFLIDPKGILRIADVNDHGVGRNWDDLLRRLQGFQLHQEHGEVCPANWNPKSNPATIKPNPKQSLEYFSKVGSSATSAKRGRSPENGDEGSKKTRA